MNATTAEDQSTAVNDQPPARQLRRSAEGAMLGGVAAGLSRYFDADVTLIRVILVALFLLPGPGPALYLAAWLLIPRDGEDQSIAAAWFARRRGQSY
jgi:phage shock protein PspC (stress-responsive transcriptional regulator)